MWKTKLIAGTAILVAGLGLQMFFGLLFPAVSAEYQNSGVFRPWSDPLMTVYFVYPIIFAITAGYLWKRIREQLSGSPKEQAGQFAKLYFIIATIPGMFISYTSMQISLMTILTWTLTGYVQAWVAGWVFAKRNLGV